MRTHLTRPNWRPTDPTKKAMFSRRSRRPHAGYSKANRLCSRSAKTSGKCSFSYRGGRVASGLSWSSISAPASPPRERPYGQGSVVPHMDQQVAGERRLFGMRLRRRRCVPGSAGSCGSFSCQPAEGARWLPWRSWWQPQETAGPSSFPQQEAGRWHTAGWQLFSGPSQVSLLWRRAQET